MHRFVEAFPGDPEQARGRGQATVFGFEGAADWARFDARERLALRFAGLALLDVLLMIRAWTNGCRVGKPGKRTAQLGVRFAVGPGGEARCERRDAHSADGAPMDEIFAALGD